MFSSKIESFFKNGNFSSIIEKCFQNLEIVFKNWKFSSKVEIFYPKWKMLIIVDNL